MTLKATRWVRPRRTAALSGMIGFCELSFHRPRGREPCLGQKTIPGREGEITNFPDFATGLHETYGRHGLFEIFDLDKFS